MNSLFNNSIFNFFSQIIIFFFAGLNSIIIARILGPAQMGQLSFWIWLIGTGGLLFTLGIPRTLIRFTALYKSGSKSTIESIISRTFIYQAKLLILITAFVLALIFIAGSDLTFTYSIIVTTLFISVLNNILGSAISGLQKYNLLLRINLLTSPLSFALSLIVLLFLRNLNNLLIVNLFIALVSLFISAYYLRDFLKFNAKPIPSGIFSEIKKYTLSISVIVFLDLILMERSEIFFLKTFSTLEQLAFYSVGFGLVGRVMTLIPGAVSGVIMPKIAWLHGNNDPEKIKLTYYSSSRYLILITFPIIFAGLALIDLPVQVFFGIEYSPLVPVVSILLVSGGLSAVVASAAAVLYGTGSQNFILKLAAIAASVNIFLDILLIPIWGAIGAASANAIAQILGVVSGTFYLVQIKKMPFPWKDSLKVLLAGIGAVVIVYVLKTLLVGIHTLILFIILAAFYIISYLTVLYSLKFFVKQDKDILKRLTNKVPLFINFK